MTPARTADRGRRPHVVAAAGFVVLTHFVHVAAGAPLTFLVLETGIGLLFIVAGAIAWRRRPTSHTGPLLVLCGPLWMLGGYNPAGLETLWAVAFAFEGYYDLVFAFLALSFPADRIGGTGRVALWTMTTAFLGRSLGRLLLTDPPRTYPDLFPPGSLVNPFAILENRVAFETVEIASSVVIAVVALGVAVIAVRRLVRSAAVTRSVIGPVIVGTIVAMLFAAFASVDNAWSTATQSALLMVPEPWTGFADWLVPAARATVPIAFLIGTLRLRSSGGPLATMAARLAREASPADVDDALAAYIENDQLASLLREQLAELRASRARIVAAGDAERRRIERALHDGAQQHLTAVAMRLDEARRSADTEPSPMSAHLAEIAGELRDAMHELRELARGIHPAILTEAGLGPAIATLARRSTIPVDLHASLDGRMPLPTEVTAYYVVAEALTNVARSARAERAEVRLERRDDTLFIRVRDNGVGGADPGAGTGIAGLQDRVRALNGRFTIASPRGHGTTIEAWLPCE
jgi:signal transduction histidine kinase